MHQTKVVASSSLSPQAATQVVAVTKTQEQEQ
jgi:hypothetical protein